MMNQNLMNLSLKPASDFNRRVTLWPVYKYNVEDFFFSKVTRIISEEEAIVNFLEKAAVKMELPCSEDYTQIFSAVVFAKNLQLAPSSLSPGMFVLC